eukprot:m.158762 g.158762  ORF g.158762 m.158762 type:complete len:435 (-) comp53003_c0_seq2:32-1336(-)
MWVVVVAVALCVWGASGQYTLGLQGESCTATCGRLGRTCLTTINTNNSALIFEQLGSNCTADTQPWWAANQPCACTGEGDPNYGRCVGYIDVPQFVACQAQYWSVRRLCNCGEDISSQPYFGTGLSNGEVTTEEVAIFTHKIASGATGVMTHFWVTTPVGIADETIIRYYVDGETNASIAFNPPLAAGIGFGDPQAPRGNKWIGMGAGNGAGVAYFVNIMVPFSSSIVITAQRPAGNSGAFYMIVRGALNKPIEIGGLVLPPSSKLLLQTFQGLLQPLEYLNVTAVPSGPGFHFFSTLAVQSGNLNFLEGCYHAYTPFNQSYPGTIMSTGTEDYFDSAYYFDAGQFYFPVSGFTHLDQTDGITWSAYRFHEMDPLVFQDGFRFVWRNGDAVDPATGYKCILEFGGDIAGSPTASNVTSYSWVYVWDADDQPRTH